MTHLLTHHACIRWHDLWSVSKCARLQQMVLHRYVVARPKVYAENLHCSLQSSYRVYVFIVHAACSTHARSTLIWCVQNLVFTPWQTRKQRKSSTGPGLFRLSAFGFPDWVESKIRYSFAVDVQISHGPKNCVKCWISAEDEKLAEDTSPKIRPNLAWC